MYCLFITVTLTLINFLDVWEHTIYLAAKAFIEELNPRPPKKKTSTKNGSASVEDEDDNEDLDDWIEDWEQLDASSEDDNIDDVVDLLARRRSWKGTSIY